MHEMSLMRDLMKKITNISEKEKAKRVLGVHVKLGALSHISPEHFRDHFIEESAGTIAEGAELKIEVSQDIHDPEAQDILLKNIEIEEV